MHRTVLGIAALLFFIGLVAPAFAGSSPADLHREGHYAEAIQAGEAQGDGTGLRIAAEAALAIATLKDSVCLPCLNRAEGLARRAIAADPKDPRAYVTLVATLAYKSRAIGVFASERAHYATETKRALETAKSLAPDDPWILAALGGWNIEVVRIAGSLLGRALYGADFNAGEADFRRALAAEPDDSIIAYHFALALTSYDFKDKRNEIVALIEAATHGTPRDAYGEAMRKRSLAMLDLLRRNKRQAYLRLARRYLGFPQD